VSDTAFLTRYFTALDDGEDIMPFFAPDTTFAILWSSDGGREFTGGLTPGRGTGAACARQAAAPRATCWWKTALRWPPGGRPGTTRRSGRSRSPSNRRSGLVRRLFAARTEAFAGQPF
jgi:hypothetical protein